MPSMRALLLAAVAALLARRQRQRAPPRSGEAAEHAHPRSALRRCAVPYLQNDDEISRRSRACSPTSTGSACRTTRRMRSCSPAACTCSSACTTRPASVSRGCSPTMCRPACATAPGSISAQIWYARGYLDKAEAALRKVNGRMSPDLEAQKELLLANVLMHEGRYDEAIRLLSGWRGGRGLVGLRALQSRRGAGAHRPSRRCRAVPHRRRHA